MKINTKVSKRWSTWCNLVTILVAAFTPLSGQFGIPEGIMPYVLFGCAAITGVAQAVKQGKFDD